jgi:hypothetical protein
MSIKILRRIGFRRPKTDKKYGMVAISEEFSMVAVDILHERQAGCYDFGGYWYNYYSQFEPSIIAF